MDRFLRNDAAARIKANQRLTWLAGLFLLWGAAILLKLVFLQVVRHDDYLAIAQQQQFRTVEIPAPRGSIYDRTGAPLAMSVPMDSVFINPLRVPDLTVASEILASILNLERTQLYGRMKWAAEHRRGYLSVKRRISAAESDKLRSLKLEWIEFQTESRRYYPAGGIAAHILGGVDHEERGNAGIEAYLNEELEGHPGEARLLTDVKRRGIDSKLSAQPQPGTSITLTIDERIQFKAEKELAQAVQAANAKTGSVVVMNPNTGDILAMASYPTFDPNRPPVKGDDPTARFNHAVSVPFEPGSVFKVITLSAALETTGLRPDTMINCGGGAFTIFGRTVHEAKHGYGTIPMYLVLAKSSNIGAIQIGLKVGQQNLHEYVRRFGFGEKTGLPLPAESDGIVRKLRRWGLWSLPSVAMGHEVSTTTVQLAEACAAVANGGLLVRPRLILRKAGQTVPSEPPKRIIRPETAITMRQMMEGVVVLPSGTGRKAKLDGYSSGGKTGSAQIYDFVNHHYTHNYNASFMGFAPVGNPAVVVVVTLNGTRGSSGYGGTVAAPVFRAVAQEALRVLDIPKDLPEEPQKEEEKIEDKKVTEEDLAIAELASPEPTEEEEAETQEQVAQNGPKAPDFQGKTVREVMEEASAQGVPVLVTGSGVARVQEPRAGAVLQPGERIRVQFAR